MRSNIRVTLRLSLAGALILTVIITSLSLGGVTFIIWNKALKDDISRHLSQMASTTALLIEAKNHEQLQVTADMDTVLYRELRDKLKAIRAIDPDIRFLYTFRWTEGEPYPRFILDTGIPGVDFSALGDEYPDLVPALLAAFSSPYRIQVDKQFYTDEFGTWLSAFAPILHPDGRLEGVIGLDIDAGRVVDARIRLLVLISGLTLGIIIVMGFLSWFFSRMIARPLLVLSTDMEQIKKFNLESTPITDSNISEILLMENALENMKKGLRSFRKYVPADLVAELVSLEQEAELGTQKRDITVFFCDIENFTTASEQMSSDDLNSLLSSYFSTVTGILQKHGATIDKFIGDAVMAFWGAPRLMADHELKAGKAVLELMSALEELRARWRQEDLPDLRTRIGLNSGFALVGNVGHDERLSYTALGDCVNLASRLESLNKYYNTQILAGENTLRGIGAECSWRPVDKVAVKGRTKGTLIGEICEKPQPWWGLYNSGWKAYKAGDWQTAADAFDKVLASVKHDGPSRVLGERCKRFLRDGVPENWNGVWVMHEK